MGPTGQLWGPLVSLAFIHIRARPPQDSLFGCGSSISLGSGLLLGWALSRGLGWDPKVLTLCRGSQRQEAQTKRIGSAGSSPDSESWTFLSDTEPQNQELGVRIQGLKHCEGHWVDSEVLWWLGAQLRSRWVCAYPVGRSPARWCSLGYLEYPCT